MIMTINNRAKRTGPAMSDFMCFVTAVEALGFVDLDLHCDES